MNNPPSSAQLAYLKHRRAVNMRIHIARILLLLLFLVVWELAAHYGYINAFIFSSPIRLVQCFIQLLKLDLLSHIGVTLLETLLSFFFVISISIAVSILLWWCPKLSATLEPYLVVLNALPKSALAPILIVWLGANFTTIVVCGLSVAIFGSILNLYTSFSTVEQDKIKLIKTLGGNRLDTLRLVVLPSSLPNIISMMKVNIGLCLVGVIIGEFLAARKGLGYLIIYGSQVFKLDWVLLSIILLCIIAILLYAILTYMEKNIAANVTKSS